MTDRIKQIDWAVSLIQKGNSEEIDRAARALLFLFRPLVIKTSKSITNKVPHSMEEVLPICESTLIKIAMEYLTPRRDTQGEGKFKGEWAPNFNVYLRQNLYHFTRLEVAKDVDGPGRKNRKYNGPANASCQQYSVVLEQELHPEYVDDFPQIKANEVLGLIERKHGMIARELFISKYLFRQKGSVIRWILGISNLQIKALIDAVKEDLVELLE